jgi:hypothetical protein
LMAARIFSLSMQFPKWRFSSSLYATMDGLKTGVRIFAHCGFLQRSAAAPHPL